MKIVMLIAAAVLLAGCDGASSAPRQAPIPPEPPPLHESLERMTDQVIPLADGTAYALTWDRVVHLQGERAAIVDLPYSAIPYEVTPLPDGSAYIITSEGVWYARGREARKVRPGY